MAQNHTRNIWSYFSVEREDDVKAQCNHCIISPTREIACQLITPNNFWFWKKICLNFELAATLNNVNLMDY